MKVRYYADPRTELPHIYRHDVSELETEEALEQPAEDYTGRDGTRFAIAPTSTDRILRVIYATGRAPHSVFVITAYDLRGDALIAHRGRKRRQ